MQSSETTIGELNALARRCGIALKLRTVAESGEDPCGKPEHVFRLGQLMERPPLTMRSQLILVRRMASHLHTERAATLALFGEEVKQAKAGLLFTKRKLAKIKDFHGKSLKAIKSRQLDIGAWLYRHDGELTERYGFVGICDLLEVNPAHRGEVIKYAENIGHVVWAIAFTSGFEDSLHSQSGRCSEDWKSGPFYQAFWELMASVRSTSVQKSPQPTCITTAR